MSDEIKKVPETVVPNQPVAEAPKAEPAPMLTMAELEAKLAEKDKAWQSRFDKVLNEKKQTETKATTVEERLAQIERERAEERTAWARKEARAKAGIDDEFESAVLEYASSDPEKISGAADKLKAMWAKKEAAYKAEIEQLQKQNKYGAKAPSAGTSVAATEIQQMNQEYIRLKNAGRGVEAERLYLDILRKQGELNNG